MAFIKIKSKTCVGNVGVELALLLSLAVRSKIVLVVPLFGDFSAVPPVQEELFDLEIPI